jgi:hypothetical protein
VLIDRRMPRCPWCPKASGILSGSATKRTKPAD